MTETRKVKVAGWFKEQFEALQVDPVFLAEDVILDVMEQIHERMEAEGINQTELAQRLAAVRGVEAISRSAISQLLSGDQNISIRRLVEVALALGMTITPPQLVPLEDAEIESVDANAWNVTMVEAESLSRSDLRRLWAGTTSEIDKDSREAEPAGALQYGHRVSVAGNDYSHAMAA